MGLQCRLLTRHAHLEITLFKTPDKQREMRILFWKMVNYPMYNPLCQCLCIIIDFVLFKSWAAIYCSWYPCPSPWEKKVLHDRKNCRTRHSTNVTRLSWFDPFLKNDFVDAQFFLNCSCFYVVDCALSSYAFNERAPSRPKCLIVFFLVTCKVQVFRALT